MAEKMGWMPLSPDGIAMCQACDVESTRKDRRGHLKRIPGLGRLGLREPCGAKDELLLAATAQNLRKPAKLFPAGPEPEIP